MSISTLRDISRLLSVRLRQSPPAIVAKMKRAPKVRRAIQLSALRAMKSACGTRYDRECSDRSSRQLYLRKRPWRKLHGTVQNWIESKIVNTKSRVLRGFFKRHGYKKIKISSGKRYIGLRGSSYRHFKRNLLPAIYNALVYRQIRVVGQRVPSVGPQKNKPPTPKLTVAQKIKVGMAFKRAYQNYAPLRQKYKTFKELIVAISKGQFKWDKPQNHPRHVKLVWYLNLGMPKALRPSKRFPAKYSDSQMNQRVYAAWLLNFHLSK